MHDLQSAAVMLPCQHLERRFAPRRVISPCDATPPIPAGSAGSAALCASSAPSSFCAMHTMQLRAVPFGGCALLCQFSNVQPV